ncbi:MAG: ParB/RepB/Spo0J family partition protein [Acidimicrobiales bacterium]
MSRRSGLGRGLGALIPSDLAAVGHDVFREVPLAAIEPNRYQPRVHFDEASIVALSESIRELGVLQPVLLREVEGDLYELVAGERRWRAARKAGLSTIPAIVRPADDRAALEQALVENLHRADLSALEEAAAYQQLMEDFGMTQEQVAARVGKSRSAVANTLRLLQLPTSTQRLLADGRLSAGHARALLSTPDRSLQERLARQVADESWTVRQVEEAVRRSQEPVILEVRGPVEPATVEPGVVPGSGSEAPPFVSPEAAGASASSPGGATAVIDLDRQEPAVTGSGQVASGPTVPAAADIGVPPPAGLVEVEQLLGDYLDTTVRITSTRSRGRLTIEFADIADLERIFRLIIPEG